MTRTNLGPGGRKAVSYLCLSLAIAVPLSLGLATSLAKGRLPSTSLLTAAALIASLSTLVCVVLALRCWPYAAGPEGRLFKRLAWVFPPINVFRRVVQADAKLEADFTSVLAAYRFGTVQDVKTWVADARERASKGRGPEPLSPEELADQLVLDLLSRAGRVASQVVDDLLPKVEGEEAGMHQLLVRCLVMLYIDHQSKECPWGDAKDPLIPLLAWLVTRHEIFAGAGESPEVNEVATALRCLQRFSLQQVVDILRRAPRLVVDNMENVVRAYGLGSLDSGLRRTVQASLAGGISKTGVVAECALRFAEGLPGEPADVHRKARLLELLYSDRFGLATRALWSGEHKDELIEDLTCDLSGKGSLAQGPLPFVKPRRPGGPRQARPGDAESFGSAVFEKMDDFDMSLAVDVGVRVGKLRQLADHYAEYLRKSGMERARARLSDVLKIVRGKLPANRSDRGFEARDVELDLLENIGERWVSERRVEDTKAGMRVPAEDDLSALALVLASSYLTRASRRRVLASDLAFRAGGVEHKDPVARILLALMWRHQSSGGGQAVPLDALVRDWDRWLGEVQRKEGSRSNELLKQIRAELSSGVWPTKIPLGPALVGLTDRLELVIEMLHKEKDSGLSEADKAELQRSGILRDEKAREEIERALTRSFHEAQADMRKVQVCWGQQMEERIRRLVEEIQIARDPGESELESSLRGIREALKEASATPIARLSEQVSELADSSESLADKVGGLAETDRSLADGIGRLTLAEEELGGEIGGLVQTDRDLCDKIEGLRATNGGLSDQVGGLVRADCDLVGRVGTLRAAIEDLSDKVSGLEETDRTQANGVGQLELALEQLAREMRQMMDQDERHSSWYLITFGSKSGPMADDIDDLTKAPHHDYHYKFEPYKACGRNARIGRRAPGISFEDFYRRFTHDLEEAKPALPMEEVAVQLIARPRGKNVPKPEPDAWTQS